MNCNSCGRPLRVLPEQVGVDPSGVPIYQSFGYCDNCCIKYSFQENYFNQNKKPEYSNTGLILSIIGLAGCIASVFMPFIKASAFGFVQTENLFDNSSDAVIILILSAIGLVVCSCKCKTYTVDTIVAGALNAIVGFVQYSQLSKRIDEMSEYSGMVSIGFGAYLLIVSSILTIIGGIIMLVYKKQVCLLKMRKGF